MQSDLVQYRRDGHVVTITYNRPDKLNAIDGAMRAQINDAFARFRDDEEAWVGVVTGAGRAFCVGADLGSETGNPAGEFPGSFWERPTVNSFESGWEIFKPVIAAVNGYCLGYGLTLLTWCDFVVASERAEFGFPEVRVGVPTIVGALRLPQRINWQYAMELLLTGERIDATRAWEAGLLSVPPCPPDLLMAEAHRVATLIASGSRTGLANLLDASRRSVAPPALAHEAALAAISIASADGQEGIAAFAERRPPVFHDESS